MSFKIYIISCSEKDTYFKKISRIQGFKKIIMYTWKISVFDRQVIYHATMFGYTFIIMC